MERRRPSKSSGKVAPTAMFVVAALLALFAVLKLSPLGRSSDLVQQELNRLRLDGIATEAADLRPALPVPDSQNAAIGFQAAHKLYHGLSDADRAVLYYIYRERIIVANPLSASEERHVREILHRCIPTFDRVSVACLLPRMDPKRNWEKGPRVLFPDYAFAAEVAQALLVQAWLDDRDGKPVVSLARIDSIARMAHHFSTEPAFIARFVQRRLFTLSGTVLHAMLKEHGADRQVLKAERKVLTDFGPPADFRTAIAGEVVSARAAAETFSSSELKSLFGTSFRGPLPASLASMPLATSRTIRDGYEARALRVWREVAERLPDDPSDYPQAIKVYRETERTVWADKQWQADLFKAMFPYLGHTGDMMADYESRRRTMLCGIDVLDWRLAHHAFPERLVSSGEESIDPFTGSPLTYKLYREGFKVYSFGKNGEDDNGETAGRTSSRWPADDIAFIYQ